MEKNRKRDPKRHSRMDNPETRVTFGTRHRTTINTIHETTQENLKYEQ